MVSNIMWIHASTKNINNSSWFDKECESIVREKENARMKWTNNQNRNDYEQYKKIKKTMRQIY